MVNTIYERRTVVEEVRYDLEKDFCSEKVTMSLKRIGD